MLMQNARLNCLSAAAQPASSCLDCRPLISRPCQLYITALFVFCAFAASKPCFSGLCATASSSRREHHTSSSLPSCALAQHSLHRAPSDDCRALLAPAPVFPLPAFQL